MTPEPGIFPSINLLSKWPTDFKCFQSCYLESTASCFQNFYIKTQKITNQYNSGSQPSLSIHLCAKHLRQMRLEIFFCSYNDIKSQGVYITCPNRSQRWQMLGKDSAQVSHIPKPVLSTTSSYIAPQHQSLKQTTQELKVRVHSEYRAGEGFVQSWH